MLDARLHARTAKRIFLRWVSKNARPHLRSYGMLQTVKIKRALVGNPGSGRILVLAPHMDDEVIGCGGTLHKHALNGAEVMVVFLTDGKQGSRDLARLTGEERRQREDEVAHLRKQEAKKALRILGVRKAIYWNVGEFALTTSPHLPLELATLIKQYRPELVYLPFFLEDHPDHRAVSWLLNKAAHHITFHFDCLGYEVWTPLFPNYLVEISDVIGAKKMAMEEYRSQLAETNYLQAALGLNAFRANLLLKTNGYAEAFFGASLQEYLELYRSYVHWQSTL